MNDPRKMSAGFHRLRRAHFARKNAAEKKQEKIANEASTLADIFKIADGPSTQIWEPRKGRT